MNFEKKYEFWIFAWMDFRKEKPQNCKFPIDWCVLDIDTT